MKTDKVNILLVDDQPSKLLSYELMLRELDENLIKASSGKQALELLLKTDAAVVLIDVCMPELDGFELAATIRAHPRFERTAIIFVSAIHLTDGDTLRGYEMGAVDYVPVPVIPEVLRAKVRVFTELYRKTRQLEQLNRELEQRVAERTLELERSTTQLVESEQRRSLALAAASMGSWDWDIVTGNWTCDEGHYRILGVQPDSFKITRGTLRRVIHPEDWKELRQAMRRALGQRKPFQAEFRVRRPNGEIRWCLGTTIVIAEPGKRVRRVSGVTLDITERKETEERQTLLMREVDHRARNALAVMQSILRLTRSDSISGYVSAVEGRVKALSRAHTLLSESRWSGADLTKLVDEELAPYRMNEAERVTATGPQVSLSPGMAQAMALALHELATNAVKHGALSSASGRLRVTWDVVSGHLELRWQETGGPPVRQPAAKGFGTVVIGASIEQQLSGQTLFEWLPQGLSCSLRVPLYQGTRLRESAQGFAENGRSDNGSEKNGAKVLRVLLVEDEFLVASMMADLLAELGAQVVGPFSRVTDALDPARRDAVDFAILDINLGNHTVYPVAELLARRGVPFVFVTGYGTESLDQRFAANPVLQKPIERRALEKLFKAGRLLERTSGPFRPSAAAPS